jgi:hypothetical protein
MHPDIVDIAAYVEGRLSDVEQVSVEAHLASCAECRDVATGAATLLRGEARRRRWVAGGVAVAAAAVIVLMVSLPVEQGGPVPDVMRDGPAIGTEGLASVEVVGPDPDHAAHPDSVVFAWRAVASAALYQLSVTDGAGGAVWETTTADTTVRPPADTFEPDARYLWYVDALLPDGNVASTGVKEFRTGTR